MQGLGVAWFQASVSMISTESKINNPKKSLNTIYKKIKIKHWNRDGLMFETAKLSLSTTLLLVSSALWCTLCKALRQWVSHMGEQEWKPRKMNKLVNFVFVQPSIHWSKAWFLFFKFPLFHSNFCLTRENETKIAEQFKKKLQYLDDKIDQCT